MLFTTQRTKHISVTLLFLALIAFLDTPNLYSVELIKMQDLDFGEIEKGIPALHVISPLDVNAAVFNYNRCGCKRQDHAGGNQSFRGYVSLL